MAMVGVGCAIADITAAWIVTARRQTDNWYGFLC